MTYTLRDHTADVAVEAAGETIGDVFSAVADGLAGAQCDSIPKAGDRFTIEERAESREALLFEFLDRLIYERDVRGVLPTAHEATIREENGQWVVRATACGVPLEGLSAREVKAVTYAQMQIEERPDGWYAYVVFDV